MTALHLHHALYHMLTVVCSNITYRPVMQNMQGSGMNQRGVPHTAGGRDERWKGRGQIGHPKGMGGYAKI